MEKLELVYGFPIVTASDVYDRLAKMGIGSVSITSKRLLSDIDPKSLTPEQTDQLRFAPKVEVLTLEGSGDLWFRTSGKDWACTFVLLEDDGKKYVVLVGEWKHGHEWVSVVPPSGVPKKGETMADCALRETQEEIGIALEKVIPLSAPEGSSLSGRKSTERVFPFLAVVRMKNGKPVFHERSHDKTEKLGLVVMELGEYWKFINTDYRNEAGTRDCGYAALRELGLIQFAG